MGATLRGRYELLEMVGRGGTGTVYRAHDRELDEIVALKLLLPDFANHPVARERFRREVKLARRVTHRNVARMFELGEHRGTCFLTMEYVPGESLASMVERERRLSIARVGSILEQVSSGLAAAHEVGVVHRDVKPGNIMVTDEGRAVVTDFGIACADDGMSRSAGTGLAGTPAYMAPEQVEAKEVTPRTDVYALGILLFELLTGARPWSAESSDDLLRVRLSEPPLRARELDSALPRELDDLIADCMKKDPSERPASTREVWRRFARATALVEPMPKGRSTPRAEKHGRAPLIAVLPFSVQDDGSDAPLQRLLSEGVSDALCRNRGVRVLSPRVVARAASLDPQAMAGQFGVGLLVEGSVEPHGDRVSVSLRIVDASDGVQSWAERFDSAKADLGSLPEEIAREIASALSISTDPGERVPMNAWVLELYLRARRAYRQYDAVDAVDLLETALRIAPGHPMLEAWLVAAMVRRAFLPRGAAPLSRAITIAERAASRAPDLGEARFALALAHLHAGDAVLAARALKKAVALAPSLAEANGLLGDILVEVGRIHDGIRRLEVALALDGEMTSARWAMIRALLLDGRTEEGIRALDEEAHRRDHRRQWIPEVRVLSWLGDRARMERAAEALAAEEDNFDNRIASRTLAFFLGKSSALKAYEAVERRVPESRRGHALAMQSLAEVAGHAGDVETGLRALTRACDEGLIDLAWLDRCRLLDCLRPHPRFLEIRQELQNRADEVMEALWGP